MKQKALLTKISFGKLGFQVFFFYGGCLFMVPFKFFFFFLGFVSGFVKPLFLRNDFLQGDFVDSQPKPLPFRSVDPLDLFPWNLLPLMLQQ